MMSPLQGDMAPDFTLIDNEGQAVRLSAYRGVKNVVLVLNRGLG